MTIDALLPADWPAVRAIYEEGLDIGTFDELVPTWEELDRGHLVGRASWRARMARCSDGPRSRPTRTARATAAWPRTRSTSRAAPAVAASGAHCWSGSARRRDAAQIWTIQAGILAANEASIKLHAACGFRLVGVREKLARKRGEWSDVVLMERRSDRNVG